MCGRTTNDDTDKLYGKPYKQPLYGKSYIDTDKLKRLAVDLKLEVERAHHDQPIYEQAYSAYRAILALIAENERLKSERDEAVALLRPLSNMATVCGKGGDDSVYVGQSGIRLTYGDFRRAFAFLARIDAAE